MPKIPGILFIDLLSFSVVMMAHMIKDWQVYFSRFCSISPYFSDNCVGLEIV
jgi:hypothetical protein